MIDPTLNPIVQYLRNQFIIGPFPRAQLNPTRTHMNKDQIEKLIAHTKSNVSDLQSELNRYAHLSDAGYKLLCDEKALLSALESDLEALCEDDEE